MRPKLAKILADLDDLVHALDLDRDGLGEALMDCAADAMLQDMDAEQDPDGGRWPDLSEAYEREKSRVAPGLPMAELLGNMKTRDQLAGERSIAPHAASMTFGVSEPAQSEGPWFHNGDPGMNRPPRPFYAFSAESIRRQVAILAERAKAK